MGKTKIILYLILSLYGLIGYSPYFKAIDQVAPQWLELSILNVLTLLFFQFNNSSKSTLNHLFKSFKNPIVISLLCFSVWGLISFTYAINTSEVIIKFSQWINVILSISIVYVIIKELKINFFNFSVFMSILLSIEVFASMKQFFELIQIRDFEFGLAGNIKGLTGNKNITSASIAIKIPFLINILWSAKKQLVILVSSVLLFISYLDLIFLSSRAVYISILSVNILIFLFYFIFKKFQLTDYNLGLKNLLLSLGIFLGSLTFSVIYLGEDNSANVTKRIQTINFEDESTNDRIRYYNHAISHFLQNPIIGTGWGNWKIKSIDYDSNNMKSYVVPYHVHNDFLEILTELGIIGLLFYLIPFVYIAFTFLRGINSIWGKELFFICLALLVYFIDANLNFPHARVINQLSFVFIASFALNLIDDK